MIEHHAFAHSLLEVRQNVLSRVNPLDPAGVRRQAQKIATEALEDHLSALHPDIEIPGKTYEELLTLHHDEHAAL